MIEIGVDFGGTKVEVAALGKDGRFLSRRRAPNPGSYDAAIGLIRDLVRATEQEVGGSGVLGIGTPGSVWPQTGLMRNSNSTWLNSRRFREDLVTALERDVFLTNDANCLALSEAIDGAAADARVVFAVILGTGCGGGLVVDRRLVEGGNGNAGEWGHSPLGPLYANEFPSTACWCGRRGCIETWVSGSGLQRDHRTLNGGALTSEQIVQAATAGTPDALATIDRFINRLGRALAMICNLLDPDTLVFGGGASNIPSLLNRLPAAIVPHVFSDAWSARLVEAKWGDSSGVRGAARLWRTALDVQLGDTLGHMSPIGLNRPPLPTKGEHP